MNQAYQLPLAVYAVLVIVAAGPASGQDSETQALRKEVEELRQKVQKLEEQQTKTPAAAGAVAPGEKSSAAAASQAVPQQGASPAVPRGAEAHPAASAPNSIIALRQSWSRVAKKMSQAEIADVLGQPTKETRIDGKRVWYYYYPGVGGSSVFFKADGHVSSYQPPNTGWW
jgi:hypothetical protein